MVQTVKCIRKIPLTQEDGCAKYAICKNTLLSVYFCFLLSFDSCLLICISNLPLLSFTQLFSNHHCLQRQGCAAGWECLLFAYMICSLMSICCNSTLTCSLAWAIGLFHDETNTKLSIEQPIDLEQRGKKILLPLTSQLCLSRINLQAFFVTWQFPVLKH